MQEEELLPKADDEWLHIQTSNVPIIAEHDTWISCDPVIGCPAHCAYCYLIPLGLTRKRPFVRISAEACLEALVNYTEKRPVNTHDRAPTPIAVGNYTDMFMTKEARAWLIEYVPLHASALPAYPLCLITKSVLQDEDLAALDECEHPILCFLSQSFLSGSALSSLERGPISSASATVENIRKIAKTRHLLPIHFWRPLTEVAVPDLDSALRQLSVMQAAGSLASVAIGLKVGDTGDPLAMGTLMQGASCAAGGGEHIAAALINRALKASDLLNYPVYRNTSCAVALALARAEALGTWRTPVRSVRCEPCWCPPEQRARCDRARLQDSTPSRGALADIARGLGVDPKCLRWSSADATIFIDAEVRQEDHARMLHTFGFRLQPRQTRRTLAWRGAILDSYDDRG